jgi:hypothetical protein
MYYEDVKVKSKETVSGLAVDYGYKSPDWRRIWDDPKNSVLKNKRGVPEKLQVGDTVQIPIPWKVVSRVLNVEAHGVGYTVQRDGEKGVR